MIMQLNNTAECQKTAKNACNFKKRCYNDNIYVKRCEKESRPLTDHREGGHVLRPA